jgi:hypothetical protein
MVMRDVGQPASQPASQPVSQPASLSECQLDGIKWMIDGLAHLNETCFWGKIESTTKHKTN